LRVGIQFFAQEKGFVKLSEEQFKKWIRLLHEVSVLQGACGRSHAELKALWPTIQAAEEASCQPHFWNRDGVTRLYRLREEPRWVQCIHAYSFERNGESQARSSFLKISSEPSTR
jgi:hypothetical protein